MNNEEGLPVSVFKSAIRKNHPQSFFAGPLDGVYAADDDDHPQFQPLLAPEDEEIAQLTASLAERIPALLQRRGLGPEADPEESDSLRRDQPWLAGLYSASVAGRVAFGPNAG